jgi:Cu-Zn family superoxide dismutase
MMRTKRYAQRGLLLLVASVLGPAVWLTGAPADRRGEARVFTLEPSTHGNPEGVAYDESTGAFFVGATGDGTIYRGTLDHAQVSEFIPGAPGREAAGMKVAGGRLYVAGGFSGRLTVYDIATKQVKASFEGFGAGMLNDLVVTAEGDVYVTDSFVPRLWRFTAAQIARGWGAPEGIPMDPEIEWDYAPFSFNLNGIVALRGGRSLIVVQTNTGKLFRIDLGASPQGRQIRAIEVEALAGGDGLLLDGGDLLVVQGGIPATINFVRLDGKVERGTVVERRSDPALRDSSTIARARNYYLVVNLDLLTFTTPFTVAGIPRNFSEP